MVADPRRPFASLRPAHPRLMITPALIQRAKAAIADTEGQRIKRKVVKDAQEVVAPTTPMPKREPDDTFINEARATLARFQTLAMARFIDQDDPRYVKRIKDELAVVCGFYDWNPLHFLDTAEMTHAVAIAYDWFHDQLGEPEKEMCRRAILEKGLRRGYEQLIGTPKPAWPTSSTNWNIVCNSALMIGALAIAQDVADPLPETVFQRALEAIPTGFHGYSPDGGWDEGPGYWAYATSYAGYLLTSLDSAIGQQFGLGGLPGFREGGYFRMHCEGAAVGDRQLRRFFNFSDCEEQRSGSWCMRWLALYCNEPQFNWMAHKDAQAKAMDLFWYQPKAPGSGNGLELFKKFEGRANVAMLRGAWGQKAAKGFQPWVIGPTEDEVFLGIRAGATSRENAHGHLDLGSFVLDALQVRWATDLQPVNGDYLLPGYFDVDQGRRFRYYRTSTAGHNTLVVNGFNQALGAQTEIVAFRADPNAGLAVAVVDLTGAYPDCLRVRRGFALIGGRHVCIVDELTPKAPLSAAWQMHTAAKPTPQGRRVVLEQTFQGNPLKFYVQLIEPQSAAFTVQPAAVTLPGEPSNDAAVCKLVATFPDVAKPTRISVYLSPEEPLADPVLPATVASPLWQWIEWAVKG